MKTLISNIYFFCGGVLPYPTIRRSWWLSPAIAKTIQLPQMSQGRQHVQPIISKFHTELI